MRSSFEEFIQGISFRFVDPLTPIGSDGWFHLRRKNGTEPRLLELPKVPLDLINTVLPTDDFILKESLRCLLQLPRMSTFAISAIINQGVRAMPEDEVFVNIGLWHGFTFLSGLPRNASKLSVGVDNFSQFGGPSREFSRRFNAVRSPKQKFHNLDFREYFHRFHEGKVGFYIYDGEHSYQSQLEGLQIAEPFFSDDCIILVDDTNWPEPRQAIRDFIHQSPFSYRLLLDCQTYPSSGRLTYWNGVTVFQKTASRSRKGEPFELPDPLNRFLDRDRPREGEEKISKEETCISVVIGVENKAGRTANAGSPPASSFPHPYAEILTVKLEGENSKRGETDSVFDAASADMELHDGAFSDPFQMGLDRSEGDYVTFMDRNRDLSLAELEEAVRKGEEQSRWILQQRSIARDISSVIPEDSTFVLVDEDQLNRRVSGRRTALPFLERGGKYWGRPANDRKAIEELERLRESGAEYIVFIFSTFWWLEHYTEFADFLHRISSPPRASDHTVIFHLD